MRTSLLIPILLAVATGACSQSLTPDMTGTGGAGTGAGGKVGPPNSGSGGSGGSNQDICNTLSAEYQSALTTAVSCQVGASGQCQQIVRGNVSGCACPTYVTDGSALATIQTAWLTANCETLTLPCAIDCSAPVNNTTCVSTFGGSAGVCSYAPGTGGTSGAGGGGAAGGTSGAGGSAVDGGLGVCGSLASEYAAAVVSAKSCAAGATGQCAQSVPAFLSSCPACTELVTDRSVPDAIRVKWNAAGCGNTVSLCGGVSCVSPASAACVPSDAGGSVCSDVYELF
jgi:hypothetical protein